MKSRLLVTLFTLIAVLLAGATVAGAQGYEPGATDDGVFEVPAGAVPGSAVTFVATGLKPFATVTIVLLDADGNPVTDTSQDLSITVQADENGRVETVVNLPADLEPGAFTLSVTSEKADGSPFTAETSFVVNQDGGDDDDTDDPPAELAITGSSIAGLAVASATLLALGGAMLFSARRRDDS